MFSRRKTIVLWFATVAGIYAWAAVGLLILQSVPNKGAAEGFLMVGAVAILAFGVVLTASIFFSTMFHLAKLFGAPAEQHIKEYGRMIYFFEFVFWKEIRNRVDRAPDPK